MPPFFSWRGTLTVGLGEVLQSGKAVVMTPLPEKPIFWWISPRSQSSIGEVLLTDSLYERLPNIAADEGACERSLDSSHPLYMTYLEIDS